MNIPAMTPQCVHDYLYEVGRRWKGRGVAVELGSWLGATAVPLIKGLQEAGYDRAFYAYDRWTANEEEVVKAKTAGTKIAIGQNLEPLFRKNVQEYCADGFLSLFTQRSQLINFRWRPIWPIEICIFDAPKRNPVFSHVIKELSAFWIPGITILGLLDYYFYRGCTGKKARLCQVQERWIRKYREYFTLLKEWPTDICSCAFFRYEGGDVSNALDC